MTHLRSIAMIALIAMGAVSHVHAAMVTLSAARDTSIFELPADNNAGAHGQVFAGTSGAAGGAAPRRGLVAFELGAIPEGATIVTASLSWGVTFATPGGPNSTFDVHRITADWGEGTGIGNQGRIAIDGEATWNSSVHNATLWSSAGGDFMGLSSGSATVAGIGTYEFSSANLVADVQLWLDDPGSNFGLILISQSEDVLRTARRFGSIEGSAPAQLTIGFSSVPLPGALPLLVVAVAGAALLRRRRALRRR